MKKFHLQILLKFISLLIFCSSFFILYGLASTTTRGGYVYEYVNTEQKKEVRAHKKAVKKWEREVKARQWRVDNYPEWLVKFVDKTNPVGERP